MQVNNIYNNDSENQILQKRSLEEVKMCIENLNYITEECDYLAKISSNKIKDRDLRDEFLSFEGINTNMHNTLIKYRNTVEDFLECIDLDCDLFYENEHNKNRDLYKNHLKIYREIKQKVFVELLIED